MELSDEEYEERLKIVGEIEGHTGSLKDIYELRTDDIKRILEAIKTDWNQKQ